MTVLSTIDQSSVDAIIGHMGGLLKRDCSLDALESEVSDRMPFEDDAFSRFRHVTFFLQKLLPRIDQERQRNLGEALPTGEGEHPCTMLLRSLLLFDREKDASGLPGADRGNLELFCTLGAAVLLNAPLPYDRLFSASGKSVFIDSLIRQQVRSTIQQHDREASVSVLRDLIRARCSGDPVFTLMIDTAAEHAMPVLTEGEAADLLMRFRKHDEPALSLMRYIGECGFHGMLPTLCTMLAETDTSLPLFYCLVDVVAQLGGMHDAAALDEARKRAAGMFPAAQGESLTAFIGAAIEEVEDRSSVVHSSPGGAVLAQCMFYGDILYPGQAGGGGLTTFLKSLGNSLSAGEAWDAVYTLVLMPMGQSGSVKPLVQRADARRDARHYVLRIPVSFPFTDQAAQFAMHEYEIMRSITRTLERYGIDPDLFHLRYSDNASRGVMTLAKRLGKRAVFTLTPDPHRNFTGRDGSLLPVSEEAAIRDLNKVFIADNIIEMTDGIILIGHHRKNNQILPYFPQLWLEKGMRRKPLEIIAEGVRPSFSFLDGTTQNTYMDLLLHHHGKHRLSPEVLGEPIILNVGRLDPLKGQHHLLEAWAESSLGGRYCLVFVGGNVEHPDPVERTMLEHMDRIMETHRELQGRFCHIPAQSNPKVRLLEQSIVDAISGPCPNVYVCSSFKEEFGISILEAMASGFLAIAPRNGGVYSYMENGTTGFLIQTDTSEALRTDLEAVLDPARNPGERLLSIARQGRHMVHDTFDINRIAEDFSNYYRLFLEGSVQP